MKKKCSLSVQVDVYSYGLMLFELMTNGHKPFEELSTGFEIDKFILEVCICTADGYLHFNRDLMPILIITITMPMSFQIVGSIYQITNCI